MDRGLCHGLGVFETVLALDRRPIALPLHLARLAAGAARLGLPAPAVPVEAIGELLERQGLTKGRARVRIALGAGSGDLNRLEPGDDSFLWITAVVCPPPPASLVLVTAPFPRNERSPLAGIKCASYAENLIALDHARRHGADEALFLNTRGEVCEAATANIFAILDREIATPPLSSGCLPGTARARVIGIAASLGLPTAERTLMPGELADVPVFLTSATRGVVPVRAIDGKSLAAGDPHIASLREAWEKNCFERV